MLYYRRGFLAGEHPWLSPFPAPHANTRQEVPLAHKLCAFQLYESPTPNSYIGICGSL